MCQKLADKQRGKKNFTPKAIERENVLTAGEKVEGVKRETLN
jgi:hypothetical protein